MKPIIYVSEVDIRFHDLDPYGHVGAGRQLDYVVSSRWSYALEHFGIDANTVNDKRVGFFLSGAQIRYRRPLKGPRVSVRSRVAEIDGSRLKVPFEIRAADGDALFTEGEMEVTIVGLDDGKPRACPDWLRPLFVEDAP